MSRQQVLKLVIAVMLTLLFLVACGSSDSSPITETPPATFTPKRSGSTPITETPSATYTPKPKRVFFSDPLSTGDVAPDFTLPDSEGNMVILANQLQDNQYVVLVFYSDYN
jgi:hypothetical protein